MANLYSQRADVKNKISKLKKALSFIGKPEHTMLAAAMNDLKIINRSMDWKGQRYREFEEMANELKKYEKEYLKLGFDLFREESKRKLKDLESKLDDLNDAIKETEKEN